ncbi:MAG: transglycosylase SLT domain-containing protein [Novosphingobium sp.]
MRAAIARASQRTGVDFDYLLAQAKIESSLNPQAKAGTSSAAGLYQFTNSTWLQTLDRHGEAHGLDWAAGAIEGGRADPAMRAQIMAMRYDPNASALMAAELANDNKQVLMGVLGREPDGAELYMAHFLGADGASKFLSALQSDPTQSAAAILPKAAAANRGIFYDAGGPRSVAGVMELMRGKVNGAMNGAGPIPAASPYAPGQIAAGAPPRGGPIQQEFEALAARASTASSRTSMADTLRSTFNAGGTAPQGGAPDFVRNAYAKLQAFNL